jgi:large subunit ribosomal protein L32e
MAEEEKPAAAAPKEGAPAAQAPAKPAKPVKTEKAAVVAKREAAKKAKEEEEEAKVPRAPKRATLETEERRLLALRRTIDRRRPLFVRTASHRYWRIGRRYSWRRPRGLQSKQRRHYGYRPTVVSVGFRTPAAIRGLTPTGFRPVRVTNLRELGEIEPKRECAVIAHGVGVRKRLVLEEAARKKGVRVVNPILKEEVEQ